MSTISILAFPNVKHQSNQQAACLPVCVPRSPLPAALPLACSPRLCSRSFNTSILDFLMPTANQVACAACIWTTFVTDKPNLCLWVSVHLLVQERDRKRGCGCDGVFFFLFCVCVYARVCPFCCITWAGSICVRGFKLKSERVTFRDRA